MAKWIVYEEVRVTEHFRYRYEVEAASKEEACQRYLVDLEVGSGVLESRRGGETSVLSMEIEEAGE